MFINRLSETLNSIAFRIWGVLRGAWKHKKTILVALLLSPGIVGPIAYLLGLNQLTIYALGVIMVYIGIVLLLLSMAALTPTSTHPADYGGALIVFGSAIGAFMLALHIFGS